jgi:hypothetical protein
MTETNRHDFNVALDALAKVLDVPLRDSDTKQGFFRALEAYRFESVIEAMNWLGGNFVQIRGLNRFPVPAQIAERINTDSNIQTTPTRTNSNSAGLDDREASYESYRRRGYVIGKEATEILEADWKRRMEKTDDEQADRDGNLPLNSNRQMDLETYLSELPPDHPDHKFWAEVRAFDPNPKKAGHRSTLKSLAEIIKKTAK